MNDTHTPSDRAMRAAVEMELHATIGTSTKQKGEALDKCFPAYDYLLAALIDIQDFLKRSGYDTKMVTAVLEKAIGDVK